MNLSVTVLNWSRLIGLKTLVPADESQTARRAHYEQLCKTTTQTSASIRGHLGKFETKRETSWRLWVKKKEKWLWFTRCSLLVLFFSFDLLFFLIRWPLHSHNVHRFTDKRWLFLSHHSRRPSTLHLNADFSFSSTQTLVPICWFVVFCFFFWVMLMLLPLEARNYIKGLVFFLGSLLKYVK